MGKGEKMAVKTLIERGDFVNVFFPNTNSRTMRQMKVIYVPSSSGDSWTLQDSNDKLYYVQTYEYMELCEEPEYKLCGDCGGDMTKTYLHSFGFSTWKCHDCGYSERDV